MGNDASSDNGGGNDSGWAGAPFSLPDTNTSSSNDNSGRNDNSTSNDNNSKYHSDNNCSSRCGWINGEFTKKDPNDSILCVSVTPNYSSSSSSSSSNSTPNSVEREGANDVRNSNSNSSSSFSSNSNKNFNSSTNLLSDLNPMDILYIIYAFNIAGIPSLFGLTEKEKQKLLQEEEQKKYEFKLSMQKAREENLLTKLEFEILTNDKMEHLHKSILYKKFGGGNKYYHRNYYSKQHYTKLSIEELAKMKYLQTKRNADNDYENNIISHLRRDKIYESAEKEFYLRFQQTYEEVFFRRPKYEKFNTTLNNIGSGYVVSAQARVNTVNLATTVIRKSVKEAFIATTSMANELISINNDTVLRQMETDRLRNEATQQLISNVASSVVNGIVSVSNELISINNDTVLRQMETDRLKNESTRQIVSNVSSAIVNNAPQVIQETAEGVSSFGFEVATQVVTGYNPVGLAISGANEALSSINNRERGVVESTCEAVASGIATYAGGQLGSVIATGLLVRTAIETNANIVGNIIQEEINRHQLGDI